MMLNIGAGKCYIVAKSNIKPARQTGKAQASFLSADRDCQTGEKKVICLNLFGHGHFDMMAYEAYRQGKPEDYEYPDALCKAYSTAGSTAGRAAGGTRTGRRHRRLYQGSYHPAGAPRYEPRMGSAHYSLDWSAGGEISGGASASASYELNATLDQMAAHTGSVSDAAGAEGACNANNDNPWFVVLQAYQYCNDRRYALKCL